MKEDFITGILPETVVIDDTAYPIRCDFRIGGCIINILVNLETGINAVVVLGGMISGLASTGLYEMMRNLLNKDGSLPGKK